jgi:hypothetical protein
MKPIRQFNNLADNYMPIDAGEEYDLNEMRGMVYLRGIIFVAHK